MLKSQDDGPGSGHGVLCRGRHDRPFGRKFFGTERTDVRALAGLSRAATALAAS